MGKKNLKIYLKTAEGVPDRIVSDPERLRQILINLIGNSIKFTNTGSINVEVNLAGSDSAPDIKFIEITVTDTRIGISPEQEQSLFQRFAQADSSTTRKYGGTGLGLHLSKTLANTLGGNLLLKKSLLPSLCHFPSLSRFRLQNCRRPFRALSSRFCATTRPQA